MIRQSSLPSNCWTAGEKQCDFCPTFFSSDSCGSGVYWEKVFYFFSRYRALWNPHFFLSHVLPCETCVNFINIHRFFLFSRVVSHRLYYLRSLPISIYLLMVKTQVPEILPHFPV